MQAFYSAYLYGNETIRLIEKHVNCRPPPPHTRAHGNISKQGRLAECAGLQAAEEAETPLYVYLAWNVVHAPDEAPVACVDDNMDEVNPGRRCCSSPSLLGSFFHRMRAL